MIILSVDCWLFAILEWVMPRSNIDYVLDADDSEETQLY